MITFKQIGRNHLSLKRYEINELFLFLSYSFSKKQFQSESDDEHQIKMSAIEREHQLKMSAIEREHQAKMSEMRSSHGKTMSSIKTQSKLEAEKHQEMMKRLKQQEKEVDDTGSLNLPKFSGPLMII